jgi:gas vesicle protein
MQQSIAPMTALVALASLLLAPSSLAENRVDEYRAKLEKWVQARELASKERADWLVEKEYLRATRDLLKQERNALKADIEEFEETNSGDDEERRDLLLQRGEYQRAARALEEQIRGLEEQVLEVVPSLPEPLQQRLEMLLVQIPDDPENTEVPLGQRLMNVLGVLAQADKFNSTATFVGETRAVGGDQKVQVRTLYWGLGEAVYVDAQGKAAGIARPTAEGWEFLDDPQLAEDAQLLLDIYEGNVDTIAFIPMPVEIR